MIALIEGTVKSIDPTKLTILTESGIGYECRVSLETFGIIQDTVAGIYALKKISLYIENVYRNEDTPIMVGFFTELERQLFRNLKKITGVGLNTALSIISGLGVKALLQAIKSPEEEVYKKIKGIGPQTAKLLIFESERLLFGIDSIHFDLIEKVSLDQSLLSEKQSEEFSQDYLDAIDALIQLGWKKKVADDAIAKAFKNNSTGKASDFIRFALTK